jgi:hypothetical protein
MSNFLTDIQSPSTSKIVLFEIDFPCTAGVFINYQAGIWAFKSVATQINVTDNHSVTGYYPVSSGRLYTNINSVKINGSFYTKVSSISAMLTQAESFYFDATLQTIYIRFTNWEWPVYNAPIISLGVTSGFSDKVDSINGAYYNDVYYEPRILSVPSISKSKDFLVYGLMVFSGGSVTLNNADGFFDNYNIMNVYGQAVRIKIGFDGYSYSDFYQVYAGYLEDFTIDDMEFNINFSDIRKSLTRNLPVNTVTQTEYPYLDASNEGKYKPLAWGDVYKCPCICLDQGASQSTYTYLFLDTTETGAKSGQTISVYYVDNNQNYISITPVSVFLTAGTFVLNATDCKDTNSFRNIVADLKGFDISGTYNNALNVLQDIMSTYGQISYQSDNYDLTEFGSYIAGAIDVGVYINTSMQIKSVIEKLAQSDLGYFYVKHDGLYSYRRYNASRTPVKTIHSDELLEPLKQEYSAKEFLSSINVSYHKDEMTGTSKSKSIKTWATGSETAVLLRYNQYQTKDYDTYLTSGYDVSDFGDILLNRAQYILETITARTKLQNIDLEIMDFVILNDKRFSSIVDNWKIYEVTDLSSDLSAFEIEIKLKEVELYTP